jgi:superfamily II DNA/RNA helicase
LDLLKIKATNLGRVTYCVLDEADKMLEMGFEDQLNAITKQVSIFFLSFYLSFYAIKL